MSHDNKIFFIDYKSKQKKNQLTDRERIVFGYHHLENNNQYDAIKLLSEVSTYYYERGFHKDIARALLCHATLKTTKNDAHGKESEFYVIIYRLTKYITSNNLNFKNSGYFYLLKEELFREFM